MGIGGNERKVIIDQVREERVLTSASTVGVCLGGGGGGGGGKKRRKEREEKRREEKREGVVH